MLCNIDVFIGDQVAQAASKFQAANAQRAVIIYECSMSTDICSDELLNNKQMGKIWDLIIDNILAEKGANFSLLSPVWLLLTYQPAAKSIAAFSEPCFNIQRSIMFRYFSCNSYVQGTTYNTFCPHCWEVWNTQQFLLIYFKHTVVFTHTESTSANVLCSSIHLDAEVCLEFHTLQSLLICCNTQWIA